MKITDKIKDKRSDEVQEEFQCRTRYPAREDRRLLVNILQGMIGSIWYRATILTRQDFPL